MSNTNSCDILEKCLLWIIFMRILFCAILVGDIKKGKCSCFVASFVHRVG